MKKPILISVFAILSLYSHGQLIGTGTFANPYSGVFEGDIQWSLSNFPGGKVFINGDIYIDNEALVIDPGMTIVFVATGADIVINGTGSIYASGTAGSMIRFTADHDNDGNYGETGETWGHIVFDNPSAVNQSILEYCIIEFGDVRTGSNTTSYGGAIFVRSYNNLIIRNCILRNNRASHGGAILLFNGSTPVISNTLITGNFATISGGGIYSQARSGLTVTNSVVTQNSCGSGGGGGIFIDGSDQSRFINCTFALNTTTSLNRGSNVHFYSVLTPGIRPRFINSIIWGSDNSIDYSQGTATAATDFVFSAVQDIANPASYYTDCIDLHSDNNNSQGPNFIATDGSDWSLRFISPCRDAGTESYTGVTIPFQDYSGSSRIYIKDMGAFECQYSRWRIDAGSNDWNTAANWEASLIPTSSSDIVIPSGATVYPTGTAAPDLMISTGKYFIMEPGSRATVGVLTNEGRLQLRANSAGFSSLILNSYLRSGSGAEDIELFLSGGGSEENDDYKWHYISSPVPSLTTDIFTSVTPDLAQYVESRPTFSLRQGWVAYDGYVYSTGLMNGPTFSTLTTTSNGKGYNYFDYSDNLFTFSGLLNTSTVTAPLGFSGNQSLHGFNLLGNPFISGLDWNYIVNDPGFPSNTSKGLYFTRDNVQCSYIAGVGVPGDVNGIIPPMQGFFSKTYSAGNSIVLPAAARTHDDIHPRYKGSYTIPLVRLALAGRDFTDETVVRFDDEAKPGWDNDFDAAKLFYATSRTYIYTLSDTLRYSINGQPFPETIVEIPVVVNLISDGNHTIRANQLQGLENYHVRLIDNQANISNDLKLSPDYTFTSSKGTYSDRFVLKVSTLIYSTESLKEDADFNIYLSFGKVNIIPESISWDGKTGSIVITDLTGRTIFSLNNALFVKGSPISISPPEQKGVYLVSVRSGVLRHSTRLLIR